MISAVDISAYIIHDVVHESHESSSEKYAILNTHRTLTKLPF